MNDLPAAPKTPPGASPARSGAGDSPAPGRSDRGGPEPKAGPARSSNAAIRRPSYSRSPLHPSSTWTPAHRQPHNHAASTDRGQGVNPETTFNHPIPVKRIGPSPKCHSRPIGHDQPRNAGGASNCSSPTRHLAAGSFPQSTLPRAISPKTRESLPIPPMHSRFYASDAAPRSASRTASQNARISPASFTPRSRSTPDDTSTAHGRTTRIASPTFSGVNPPARMIG